MDQPAESSAPQSGGWYKATILRRFFAFFIDGIFVSLINFVLSFSATFSGISNSSYQFLFSMLFWLISLQYMVIMTWKYGAPLGKKWMKLKVVRTNGSNLSFGRAFLREVIGKFVSGLVLYLGYLWAFWDKNRQAWHDKIADTYVVTKIPNSGKKSGCLIALAVGAVAFIPIIAILAAVVVLIINPLELTRRGRDAARIVSVITLNEAIIQTLTQNPDTSLCEEGLPCFGMSLDPNSSNTDGSGWLKMVLPANSFKPGYDYNKLPLDPVNEGPLVYKYCSDGKDWEIETSLESEQYKNKMLEDKGDKDNMFEMGSNLTLCR